MGRMVARGERHWQCMGVVWVQTVLVRARVSEFLLCYYSPRRVGQNIICQVSLSLSLLECNKFLIRGQRRTGLWGREISRTGKQAGTRP